MPGPLRMDAVGVTRGRAVLRVRGGHSARLDREPAAGEAAIAPGAPPATQALGVRSELDVEVCQGTARPGDRFLLCTASVWAAVSRQTIASTLELARNPTDALAAIEARLPHAARHGLVVAYARALETAPSVSP